MDYIIVHKPVPANLQSIDTPKANKRKSTVQRKSVVKKNELTGTPAAYEDSTQRAFKAFEKKLDETKEQIHTDLFNSIYENTTEYFNYYLDKRLACSLGHLKLSDNEDEKLLFNPICHVIPTIALFTGINFQDYESFCVNLSEKLRSSFTPHVFYVSEKNSQNIKSLANSIFSQWENNSGTKHGMKRSMFSFKKFFEEINQQVNTSAKKRPTSLVFVFKQFELIAKDTVEQFVSLISCYVEKLPVYFVIELASQSNILYEQLSSAVISKLCIKRLYLMTPELYLDNFLTKLFIEQTTMFKLSGEVLKFLVDTYYDYNFSISSFIHELKYCYYDHLQANPLNQLFLTPQLAESELYESICNSSCSSNEFKKYNLNMVTHQDNWLKQNNQFAFICRLLFEIVKNFPSEKEEESFFSSNIRSFSDFYVKVWHISSASAGKQFTDMPQYLNLKNLLQIASSNTINDIVCSFLELIKTNPAENESMYFTDFLGDIHDLEQILSKLKQTFSVQINDISFNEEDENTCVEPDPLAQFKALNNPVVRRKSSRMTRVLGELNAAEHHPRPLLLSKPKLSVASKKQNTNTANSLKQSMIEWLEHQFRLNFNKDYSIEIDNAAHFCYGNFEKLQKRLFDVQRINVHNCLFNANDLLKLGAREQMTDASPVKRKKNHTNEVAEVAAASNSEVAVPLSAVYKIYLECGHMINLYDWLLAFIDRMENADIKELNETKRKLLQALFFRSITELQFMGFIKPTNRKVDHVVKLTNGSGLLAIEDHTYKLKINYH